ncbi:hypothetical protein Q7C_111 [Methylophaga frappieri]|uniref:DUF7931 domain-containing protein n=1 Tax=Methylophaga frappieri (strain ATCC BAA-2434 / DSM 25690 / JAM7) TaxID=754477 RepID=I1YEE9_METFJ|nr:hypothetical protein [Methylophaga frappieri]AFJ01292.1 hypothetical protein Q7C_111 [Methylophaga frappieri]
MADIDLTSDVEQSVSGRQQAQLVTQHLISQARREICFLGPTLDPLLNHHDTVQLLGQFVRASRYSQLRILIRDGREAVANGHLLLPLIQKMTSHIAVHLCAEEDSRQAGLQLLSDNLGSLICHDARRYIGSFACADRRQNQQLKQQFNAMWDRSTPDVQSRRLFL